MASLLLFIIFVKTLKLLTTVVNTYGVVASTKGSDLNKT